MRPASPPAFAPLTSGALIWAVLAMGAVVLLSNILVQYPINDWLTWGALYNPLAFLKVGRDSFKKADKVS